MAESIWISIAQALAKIGGKDILPPEVATNDVNIMEWWAVYRAKASWLDYQYVTADAVKRTRKRLTMNPARIACSEIAGLVLAEQPQIVVSDQVQACLDANGFWSNLRKNLEFQASLGGQAIKIFKESELVGLDFVKAYNFIPLEWDNTKITEAAFLDRRVSNRKSYVRVETHRQAEDGYEITSKAYDEATGIEVSLASVWPGVEASVIVSTPYPLFVYIPNPESNNIDPESPLGVSIYANAMDTIQALDMAFDGFNTEILMGRQRIALPASAMKKYVDPEDGRQKLGFDPTDAAYVRLSTDDTSKFTATDLSGQLRVEQFRLAINTLLSVYAAQIGFDSGYFSFDGKSMKTATEVISENSHTYKTIQAYRDNLKTALIQLFRAIDVVSGGQAVDPQITFDDGVIEDRNSRANYHMALVQNKLEDPISAIKAIHGLDDAGAEEMYAKIQANQPRVSDPFAQP